MPAIESGTLYCTTISPIGRLAIPLTRKDPKPKICDDGNRTRDVVLYQNWSDWYVGDPIDPTAIKRTQIQKNTMTAIEPGTLYCIRFGPIGPLTIPTTQQNWHAQCGPIEMGSNGPNVGPNWPKTGCTKLLGFVKVWYVFLCFLMVVYGLHNRHL
jgi:hypothetical protein